MKNFLKKYIPTPHAITQNRLLAAVGPRLKDPNLWHLNRRSVSAGVFAGILSAFIPLPIQIPIALFICMFNRGNFPVAVVSTWISNPLTYIPLYFFCYNLGVMLVGGPTQSDGSPIVLQLNMIMSDLDGLVTLLRQLGWQAIGPLMLGCTLVGLFAAGSAYLVVRLVWRLHIMRAWQRRKSRINARA